MKKLASEVLTGPFLVSLHPHPLSLLLLLLLKKERRASSPTFKTATAAAVGQYRGPLREFFSGCAPGTFAVRTCPLANNSLHIISHISSFPGFDKYFLGLRPPLLLSDCSDARTRGRVNCRNPWFRQFWSHHFKCRFNDQVRYNE